MQEKGLCVLCDLHINHIQIVAAYIQIFTRNTGRKNKNMYFAGIK